MEELASELWPTYGPLIVLLIGVVISGFLWVYRDDRERARREREKDREWLQDLEDKKASKEHVEGVQQDLKDTLGDLRGSVRRIEGLLMEGRRG